MSPRKKKSPEKPAPKERAEPKVRVIDMALEGTLMPCRPGVCQECAVDHPPEYPHDQRSMYWQYRFYQKSGGTWPTWKDAMAHCPEPIQIHWRYELGKRGVEVPL